MGSDRLFELLLGQFGTLVLALLIIWCFLTERIVSGRLYRRENSRSERLEGLALKTTNVAERATMFAEKESPAP